MKGSAVSCTGFYALRPGSSSSAAALVIVLAFVVLLTTLVLAFFSRAMSERGISNSSASQTKVEIFAQGAADTIVGDLQQEIVAGSNPTVTSGGTIYSPAAPTNAVPALVGSSGTNGLQNLVKRSASGQPFYTGGTNRVSSASTTTTSQNGRSISLARWNKPLLMPPTSASNLAPAASAGFTAPDWILVGRDGSNPTAVTANSTAANYVVGRYACTIYDEAGLLDANVAGYPSTATASQSTYKPALSYADLTQVGLTSAQVDKLVAWRNWASTQAPGSSFSSPGFTMASGTNYFKSVLSNPTGFLRASGSALYNGQSDRMFTGRQQLISFLQNGLSLSPTNQAFQSLGTFTRALEQPSFAPDPSRPRIVSPASPAPPAPDNSLTYRGNNDAAGLDDQINPSFLTVRITGTFTRNDGTTANIGEPLVKQRFSLKRLAWLTYKGPSALRSAGSSSTTDPDYDMWALVNTYGIPASFLQQGTVANIQKYFGLTWDNTNREWIYNHGSPGGHVIGRLNDLVSTREPDFAELLKASINVGTLGKAAEVSNTQQFQYNLDISTDYQVLQIMANIIDQFDLDSYPTRIQFSYGASTKTVAGAEDLPYAYRDRYFVVCSRKPVPSLSNNDTITFTNVRSATTGDSSTADVKVTHAVPMLTVSGNTTTISDPGEATALRIPDVWNPYDANCANTTSKAIRPTNFRILFLTYNAGDATLNWQVATQLGFWNTATSNATSGSYKSPPIPAIPPSGNTTVLLDSNSALEFQDNAGALFREPTLLWRPNFPLGSNLKLSAGNALGSAVVDANNPNNKSYVGFLIGKSPVLIISNGNYTTSDPATKSTNNNYIFQGNSLGEKDQASPGVSGANLGFYTFRVQYEYPTGSGNWFTYDEKYPGITGNGGQIFCANSVDYTNNSYLNPYVFRSLGSPACAYDPRAARFGMGTEADWTNGVLNNGPAFEVQLLSNTVSNNANIGASDFTVLMTNRAGVDKGQPDFFEVPGRQSQAAQMRWFSGPGYDKAIVSSASPYFYDGLLSQNNPAITVKAKDGTTNAQLYYEDPDGICRRAMGAYADTTLTGATAGLPLATANTIAAGGVPTATAQSQSRPFILNRPFRSVGELSYAFRGTPWKNIDFFTPESGDVALLDVFCLNDPPPDAVVAGKLNLNTRNAPVLQAVVAGAYSDELKQLASPPSYALSPTATGDALNVANKLISITTDRTAAWRGPLTNVSDLVGRYIPNPGSTGATDQYTFTETVSGTNYTYAGFSAALDSTVLTNTSAPLIQRFREAPIRALAACGQTRVWNLLIDVIAQTGRYPQSASSLDNFIVEGEKRYWVHVAIDRLTGKIIDKQIEAVTE
jgi:Tfp pilus assembly protein PilX